MQMGRIEKFFVNSLRQSRRVARQAVRRPKPPVSGGRWHGIAVHRRGISRYLHEQGYAPYSGLGSHIRRDGESIEAGQPQAFLQVRRSDVG